MKSKFNYRGYDIENDQGRYVARGCDGEEFTMASSHLLTLLRSIDALWDALDGDIATPSWFKDTEFIDLDLATPCRDQDNTQSNIRNYCKSKAAYVAARVTAIVASFTVLDSIIPLPLLA